LEGVKKIGKFIANINFSSWLILQYTFKELEDITLLTEIKNTYSCAICDVNAYWFGFGLVIEQYNIKQYTGLVQSHHVWYRNMTNVLNYIQDVLLLRPAIVL